MPNISKNKKRLPWEWKPVKKAWVSNEQDIKLYNSQAWRRLAQSVRDEEPFCRECQKKGLTTLARFTDHIQAVRLGGEFWNRANLQPLCESCHNAKKV